VRTIDYSAETFYSKADKVSLAALASSALAYLTASSITSFYNSNEWRDVLTSFN
jgi:hypothetical protein